MSTDYKRLLQAARELKGWETPSEVAAGLTRSGYEVTPQQMTNWKTRGVSKEGRLNASRIIGCRPHWLESGTGAMQEHSMPHALPAGWANVTEGANVAGFLPLISWVQAGAFCGVVDLFEPGDCEKWLPTIKKYGPHAYALRVQGDSMVSPYPGTRSYPPGYLLFIDPDRAVTNGCRVIAKLPEADEATFKVFVEEGGQRWLKPLNPQYPIIEITNRVTLCGVVVGGCWEE